MGSRRWGEEEDGLKGSSPLSPAHPYRHCCAWAWGAESPKPNARAAPWACSVPLCVTAGLGTPSCRAKPDALLGRPRGHAGDASWLRGRVAHAPWPGRRQGKGLKSAEMPSQEGATSATLPPGCWDGGQGLDGMKNIPAQNGRVGQSCRDCRAAEGGLGQRCDVRLPGMRLLLLLPEGGRCPGMDLTQPGDGRYLQLVKPQRVSCFYFWVPRSPGMNRRT